MPPTIPPHLSVGIFRFYEPLIAHLVSRYPASTKFNPVDYGRSTATFTARIRDAMRSLELYKWETFQIDVDKFDKIHHLLIVTPRKDGVWVGTPDALKQTEPSATVPMSWKPLMLPSITDPEAKLLCFLSQARVLTAPIQLSLSEQQVDALSKAYDVCFEKQSDGTYILT